MPEIAGQSSYFYYLGGIRFGRIICFVIPNEPSNWCRRPSCPFSIWSPFPLVMWALETCVVLCLPLCLCFIFLPSLECSFMVRGGCILVDSSSSFLPYITPPLPVLLLTKPLPPNYWPFDWFLNSWEFSNFFSYMLFTRYSSSTKTFHLTS